MRDEGEKAQGTSLPAEGRARVTIRGWWIENISLENLLNLL